MASLLFGKGPTRTNCLPSPLELIFKAPAGLISLQQASVAAEDTRRCFTLAERRKGTKW